MKRIGRTESTPEDPGFKDLLDGIDKVKSELKDIYISARYVVISGKQYNSNIEKFFGAGLQGEDLFIKESTFLRVMEERLCPALGSIINKELERLSESIVEYKSAKLKFDSAHFRTLKDINKANKGTPVTIDNNSEEIMEANPDLPELKKAYMVSKQNVLRRRDVFQFNLNAKINKKLDMLREASDSEHHQLYCKHFKERLLKTSKTCDGEFPLGRLKRRGTFSYGQKQSVNSMTRAKSESVANIRPTERKDDGLREVDEKAMVEEVISYKDHSDVMDFLSPVAVKEEEEEMKTGRRTNL